MLLSSFKSFAYYNFELDGIYYYIISSADKTLGVGYDSASSNYYSGHISIPKNVVYNGEIYSVTEIGYKAFYNCRNLKSINMPNSISKIGQYAFSSCTGITSISMPNSVITIDACAFQSCSNLQHVSLSDSLIFIGERAFEDCMFLSSLTIPEGVTSIEKNTFRGCQSLSSISIPNSVLSIGARAFEDCYDLTSITIPHSVTSIGNYSFADCSSMTKIHSNAIIPPICGLEALCDINKDFCELIVPDESVSAYQIADQWKDFTIISTSIEYIENNYKDNTFEIVRYDINGRRLQKPCKGINIVKYNNGLTRKEFIK